MDDLYLWKALCLWISQFRLASCCYEITSPISDLTIFLVILAWYVYAICLQSLIIVVYTYPQTFNPWIQRLRFNCWGQLRAPFAPPGMLGGKYGSLVFLMVSWKSPPIRFISFLLLGTGIPSKRRWSLDTWFNYDFFFFFNQVEHLALNNWQNHVIAMPLHKLIWHPSVWLEKKIALPKPCLSSTNWK